MTPNAHYERFASTRLYESETTVADVAAKHGLDPKAVLDFSLNVNPFGPPKSAVAAARLAIEASNLYPDVRVESLRQALARHHDVSEGALFFGAGLDDVIKLLVHALTTEGDAVLVHVPTFPRYALEAGLHGCRVVSVESAAPERTDLAALDAALARERVAMAFICSPNNPTGERFPVETISDLASRHQGSLFVVDEALIDPLQRGSLSLPSTLRNVIVLRTFSKFFGLAGLRIGYAVADPRLVSVAEVGRPPFNLSLPSMHAAIAALKDAAFLESSRAAFATERAFFAAALNEIDGVSIRGGHANMVLLNLDRRHPADAADMLGARGIIVADATSFQGLEHHHCLRVSLRDRRDNERLITAIREIA